MSRGEYWGRKEDVKVDSLWMGFRDSFCGSLQQYGGVTATDFEIQPQGKELARSHRGFSLRLAASKQKQTGQSPWETPLQTMPEKPLFSSLSAGPG